MTKEKINSNENKKKKTNKPETKQAVITKDQSSAETEKNRPSYYVGIGASAGGLEALQALFSHLPSKLNVAYIIVQHLSPDFKSMMDELISRRCILPVKNVSDKEIVEPNVVYLIPPGKNMIIQQGRLLLSDQKRNHGVNLPIDIFLKSLAEDQLNKSIAVILSGTGSDGSRGCIAVKEADGLIVVQSPETAKFSGMPTCVINNGSADIVADPTNIPRVIEQYIKHPYIKNDSNEIHTKLINNEYLLTEIYKLLEKDSAIDYSYYKPATIARRIERRMGIKQINKLEDYLSLLRRSKQELLILNKDLLIGVTRFFRDSDCFKYLKEYIFPRIFEQFKDTQELRTWIIGCATGEEAYSCAILLCEVMESLDIQIKIKIFASDVNKDSISIASNGEYEINICHDIPKKYLDKYFQRVDNRYIVIPRVRKMVVFATHNAIVDPPFSNIHFAVCRNTLIYFLPETQKKVLSSLHFALKKEGVLFLGASETLGELSQHFESIHKKFRLYRKISTVKLPLNLKFRSNKLSQSITTKKTNVIKDSWDNYKKEVNRPIEYVHKKLLDLFIPACLVVNSSLKIEYVYGDVQLFVNKMQAGEFTAELNELLDDNLKNPVNTAIYRCRSQNKQVVMTGITLTDSFTGKTFNIDLQVIPIYVNKKDANYFAIVFNQQHQPSNTKAIAAKSTQNIEYNEIDIARDRIRELEKELKNKQEFLQITVEELETTNEELQATNEELMASNEELQSTNEELQSVNEELYTVNSENQEKILELTNINADIDNMLKSTNIGIIFLDDKLLIRKFTPNITQYIPLVNSDIGRPFGHIAHKFSYAELLNDLNAVALNTKTVFREVHTTNTDQYFLIRIAPYVKPMDNTSDTGIIITITDVSELRITGNTLSSVFSLLEYNYKQGVLKNPEASYKVLVVDDYMAHIEIVRKYLDDGDCIYHIDTANSGQQALAHLSTNNYDVCLLDFKLPDMTAVDILKNLSVAILNNTAFIVCSAFPDIINRQKLAELRVFDYIEKAEISTAVLERSIRIAVQTKRSLSNLNSLISDFKLKLASLESHHRS